MCISTGAIMEATNSNSSNTRINAKPLEDESSKDRGGISMSRHSVRFADARSSEEDAAPKSGGRIAELKATLRNSFMADDSCHKSWHGKNWEYDYSSSEEDEDDSNGEDDDEFNCLDLGLDKSEHFRAVAQKEMDKSRSFNVSFWRLGNDVPEDLQAKNSLTGTTKNGVSKKRISDLKVIFKQGIMDASAMLESSSSSNNNNLMSQSCPAGDTRSATTNKLLNVMVNASQKSISQSARRRTGRGSIFVIDDEKFGNTKVVQKRLEKAAIKIQKFIRQALYTLRKFNKERQYLEREIVDTDRRRQEELDNIRQWIQDETAEFRLQLEQERQEADAEADSLWTTDDWENFQVTQDYLKQQIAEFKTENQTLQKEMKELEHEYETNQLEATNPEQDAERARLEKEVEKQTKDADDWSRLVAHYKGAIEEATTQMETMAAKRKAKRQQRKKTEKTIRKIIELTREQSQGEENTKLIEKITKIKKKREKKIQKLKEQTAKRGLILSSSSTDQQNEEKQSRRTSSRRSKAKKTAPIDDLPDLDDMDRSQNQQKSGSAEKKKKDKKQKKEKKKTPATDNEEEQEIDQLPSKRSSKAEGEDTFSKMAQAAEGSPKQIAGLSPNSRRRRRETADAGTRLGRQSSALFSLITGMDESSDHFKDNGALPQGSHEESDAEKESDAPMRLKSAAGGARRSSALYSLITGIEEDNEGERNL